MCSRVLTIGHATTRKTRLLPTSAVATSAKERSRKKKIPCVVCEIICQNVLRESIGRPPKKRKNNHSTVQTLGHVCCSQAELHRAAMIKSSYPQPGVALIVRQVFPMCSSSTSVTEANVERQWFWANSISRHDGSNIIPDVYSSQNNVKIHYFYFRVIWAAWTIGHAGCPLRGWTWWMLSILMCWLLMNIDEIPNINGYFRMINFTEICRFYATVHPRLDIWTLRVYNAKLDPT